MLDCCLLFCCEGDVGYVVGMVLCIVLCRMFSLEIFILIMLFVLKVFMFVGVFVMMMLFGRSVNMVEVYLMIVGIEWIMLVSGVCWCILLLICVLIVVLVGLKFVLIMGLSGQNVLNFLVWDYCLFLCCRLWVVMLLLIVQLSMQLSVFLVLMFFVIFLIMMMSLFLYLVCLESVGCMIVLFGLMMVVFGLRNSRGFFGVIFFILVVWL